MPYTMLPAGLVPDWTIIEHAGKKYGLYKRLGAQNPSDLSLVFSNFVFLAADLKDVVPGPDNQIDLAKFTMIAADTPVTINFDTDTELKAFLAGFAPAPLTVAAPQTTGENPAPVEKDGHLWLRGMTPLGLGWTCKYCEKYVRKDPASVAVTAGPCTETPSAPVHANGHVFKFIARCDWRCELCGLGVASPSDVHDTNAVCSVPPPPPARAHKWKTVTLDNKLGDTTFRQAEQCEVCERFKGPSTASVCEGRKSSEPLKPDAGAHLKDYGAVIPFYGHTWRRQAGSLSWVCDNCHSSISTHPFSDGQGECKGDGYAQRGPYRIVHVPINGLVNRLWGEVLGTFGTLDMAKQKVKSEVQPTLLGLEAVENRGYAVKRLDDCVAIVNVNTGVWTPVNLKEL